MKHTKEEIINALKVIRDECAQLDECKDCPFVDNNNRCALLEDAPYEWKITDEKRETWRALK